VTPVPGPAFYEFLTPDPVWRKTQNPTGADCGNLCAPD